MMHGGILPISSTSGARLTAGFCPDYLTESIDRMNRKYIFLQINSNGDNLFHGFLSLLMDECLTTPSWHLWLIKFNRCRRDGEVPFIRYTSLPTDYELCDSLFF